MRGKRSTSVADSGDKPVGGATGLYAIEQRYNRAAPEFGLDAFVDRRIGDDFGDMVGHAREDQHAGAVAGAEMFRCGVMACPSVAADLVPAS